MKGTEKSEKGNKFWKRKKKEKKWISEKNEIFLKFYCGHLQQNGKHEKNTWEKWSAVIYFFHWKVQEMRAKNEKESDEQALANFGLHSLRWVMSFCKKKGTIMKENGKVFYDIHLLIREGRVRRVAEDGRRRVEKSLSCFECNILITIFHSVPPLHSFFTPPFSHLLSHGFQRKNTEKTAQARWSRSPPYCLRSSPIPLSVTTMTNSWLKCLLMWMKTRGPRCSMTLHMRWSKRLSLLSRLPWQTLYWIQTSFRKTFNTTQGTSSSFLCSAFLRPIFLPSFIFFSFIFFSSLLFFFF